MCGNGHYSMKGVIEVVTQSEYDAWQAKQKPKYLTIFPPVEILKTDTVIKKTIAAVTKK
jgi:cytochrome c oxidase subunit 2